MITAETATSVTVQRADGSKDTILRVEIEALESTGRSLMPEGLENTIPPAAMADVIAFVRAHA